MVFIRQGQYVKLECLATGVPFPTISWTRGDEQLNDSSVTDNGTLIIQSAKQENGGEYKCTAKNTLGKKTYTFSVNLQMSLESEFIRISE